jgi:hypothetical protein
LMDCTQQPGCYLLHRYKGIKELQLTLVGLDIAGEYTYRSQALIIDIRCSYTGVVRIYNIFQLFSESRSFEAYSHSKFILSMSAS